MTARVKKFKTRAFEYRQQVPCKYCGTLLVEQKATVDHLKARARGGTDARFNMVIACYPCNRLKSDMSVSDWTEFMAKRPGLFRPRNR